MEPEIAFVALGSNVGDREQHLAFARGRIAALDGCRIVAQSRVEETAPFGPVPQGPYLNQMIAVRTSMAPRALLDALLGIEREAGRVRTVRWGPRTLDLDIVAFERARVTEPDLQVPHPGIPERDFWRREMDELNAQLATGRASAPDDTQ